jgi:hypothetical protein
MASRRVGRGTGHDDASRRDGGNSSDDGGAIRSIGELVNANLKSIANSVDWAARADVRQHRQPWLTRS